MPAKLLVVNVTLGSVTKTVNSHPVAWNATLTVTPQPHSDLEVDADGYYNGNDIKVGDYVTTTNGGRALQVTTISSKNANAVSCILEDINQINAKLDTNQGYESAIPNGQGLLFEVINGLPVIYPLPDTLPGTFDETFSVQLLNRFQSLLPAISVPENVLTDADIGVTVAGLTSGKLTSNQIPTSVVQLVDGKIPASALPSSSPASVVVANTYFDLPVPGERGVIYIVTSENSFYLWYGATYIKSNSGYNYTTISADQILENGQIAEILSNNLVLTLPSNPENGYKLIIVNNNNYTITLTAPTKTINNSFNNYIIPPQVEILYLTYINGWKISDSDQVLNNISSEQFGPPDYWMPGTIHSIVEETIYNKSAVVETWTKDSEKLAEQITIFETNSDNFVSIWNPQNGSVIQQNVTFSGNSELPSSITYSGNLLITLSKLFSSLNLNWKDFSTFESFISRSANFYNIINDQNILNLIASNAEFFNQYINCNASAKIAIPDMGGNSFSTPLGTCNTSSTSNNTDAYKAFDASNTTYWITSAGVVSNASLAFAFPSSIAFFPYSFSIYTDNTNPTMSPKNVVLKYRDNFGATQVAGRFIATADGAVDTFTVLKAGIVSNYWEFYFEDNWGGTNIKVNNIEMSGWNMNIIPT